MAWQSPVVAFDPNHGPHRNGLPGTFLPGPTMERPLCDVKRKSSTGQEVGNENRARRRGKRADVRPERNQARKPMVKKGGEQLPPFFKFPYVNPSMTLRPYQAI